MRSAEINFNGNWRPFRIQPKADAIRALSTSEGVGDRLRVVAFAELQARDAFLYGAERFPEAPVEWRHAWIRFAKVEDRHAQMLLTRMAELGVGIPDRAVTDKLTRLCRLAEDPVTFLFLLASAEERGMEAGMVLGKQMRAYDPVSASIFAQIADEEVEHVEMASSALAGSAEEPLKAKARELSLLL
jgi:uncharacterized ferritin-like protein (DUF455 family)